MDFKAGIDGYFPDTTATLTEHEIRELEARDLWFDWTEPPRPGEFGPEPGDEDGRGRAEEGRRQAPQRGEVRRATRRGHLAPPGAGGHQEPLRRLTHRPPPAGPGRTPAGPCFHLEGHTARGRIDLRRRPARHRRLRPHPGRHAGAKAVCTCRHPPENISIVIVSIRACGRSSAAGYVTNGAPRQQRRDVRYLPQLPGGPAPSAATTHCRRPPIGSRVENDHLGLRRHRPPAVPSHQTDRRTSGSGLHLVH